jgi:hypothetical protein
MPSASGASRVLLAIAGVAVVAVASGCSSAKPLAATPHRTPSAATAHPAQPPTGLITGTLRVYGGLLVIAGRQPPLYAGTVRLIGAHGYLDVRVGKSGRFVVRVPAGRYQVEAGLRHPMDWPMGSCIVLVGADVHHIRGSRLSYLVVRNGQDIHVGVGCQAP